MKNILILLLVVGIFSTFIFVLFYTKLVMRLNKQKIEILRYQISNILFDKKKNQRVINSSGLNQFATNTKMTLDLDINEYLNIMIMNNDVKKKNRSGETSLKKDKKEISIRDELLYLISSNQISNVEKEFVNNFLALQMYITSIKKPFRFVYLQFKEFFEFSFINLVVFNLFKIYAIIYAKFVPTKKSIIVHFGSYVFTATKKEKKVIENILHEERSRTALNSLKELAVLPAC
ncbi:hypothetical protein PT171_08795 [Erysipelothrix rhusiopathiae]|nr:hypothetical protein [Erysipelothrix rhusiopathiae]